MNCVHFNIDQHTIRYHVTWMGIETITVNDIQVSKKLSLPKRKHRFNIEISGKKEAFFITSKQSFSTGLITVQLFHNTILIEEKVIAFNFSPVHKDELKHPENSSFMTGLILTFLSIVFDWSPFFIFIGLMCMFNSLCTTSSNMTNSQHSEDTKSID